MKRVWIWLFSIVLFGFVLRTYDLINARGIEIDGVSYARMAEQFAQGAFGEALKNVFPPFYPLVVAVVHLAISDVELAGRLVSLIVGLLTIVVAFSFFRGIIDEKKALLGSFFLAIHPDLVRYSAQVLSESVATFLFMVTVFTFFRGWTQDRKGLVALSGVTLACLYLTRPEYIVYYLPLAILLLSRKRIGETALLLLPCVVLGLSFIGYMRIDTGMWMVSRKATLSPFVGPVAALINLPSVTYEFLVSLFAPFLLLMVLGFPKVASRFRNLLLVLVATHILSLSWVGHSTPRYSVGFVPLLIPFAAEGVWALREMLERFKWRLMYYYGLLFVVVILCLVQGLTILHPGRGVHKQAGRFLRIQERQGPIVARLPIVPFYAQMGWINPSPWCSGIDQCGAFEEALKSKGALYLVDDGRESNGCAVMGQCLERLDAVARFTEGEHFVKVYRVRNE